MEIKDNFFRGTEKEDFFPFCSPVEKLFLCILRFPNVQLQYDSGDLEIDTVVGKNHKGALLTINDRVTGLVWIRLPGGKDAGPLTKAAIDALNPFKNQIHTITADNGKKFSFHEEIARKLNISVYFAKPYHF